jgi:hypothetical protein
MYDHRGINSAWEWIVQAAPTRTSRPLRDAQYSVSPLSRNVMPPTSAWMSAWEARYPPRPALRAPESLRSCCSYFCSPRSPRFAKYEAKDYPGQQELEQRKSSVIPEPCSEVRNMGFCGKRQHRAACEKDSHQ